MEVGVRIGRVGWIVGGDLWVFVVQYKCGGSIGRDMGEWGCEMGREKAGV